MVAAATHASAPDWGALFAVAQGQSGYFTTAQAAAAGYSPPLLHKYLVNGKVVRTRRGIYRLVHFPASEHEDLVVLWLWADQAGVFSHETALALHDLSDVLPSKVHMTIPESWLRRRLRVPDGLVLHYADLDDVDRTGFSSVPITSPQRTLRDCLEGNLSPDLLLQAVLQARRRGLISEKDSAELKAALDRASQTPDDPALRDRIACDSSLCGGAEGGQVSRGSHKRMIRRRAGGVTGAPEVLALERRTVALLGHEESAEGREA